MPYSPGTHVIATLSTTRRPLLEKFDAFRLAANEWIKQHDLCKLGDVYHNFTPAGFTAVICLSESHISIHTWPEYDRVNLDIYLSNHERNNDGTVQSLFNAIVGFFDAHILQEQTIQR